VKHLKIRDLILPLAHNAVVDQKGAGWPDDWWGACLDDSFDYQLDNGIRALDLRVYRDGLSTGLNPMVITQIATYTIAQT